VAAHARYVAALAPLREAHPDRSAPELLALAMLGEYLELDPVALAERRAGAEAAAEARWRSCVPNDCDVRPEQLDAYYSGEALETSCHLPYYGQRSLATALRVRLAMLAAELGAVQMVDFGGGAGVVPHLALSLGVSSAVCIEANRGEIDFARWRERTFGFPRAMYLHPSMASSFAEEFDFAVCTEVLEHVLDVPALVRELYALLRPGGILFVTSSFGLYPHPGHLPRNICYAGRETDLMVSHGFEPCEQPSFGLPLLNGWGFYRRPEGS
jgi:SAM-dependent methyltransferase